MTSTAENAPYVEVVVDAHTKVPGGRFTYAVPPGMRLLPGHLVRVPFGQRNVHGVVVRLTDELHVDYVKPVLSLLHPEPVIDDAHLALAEWIADYYMASLFDAIAPMLPPGLRGRARTIVALKQERAAPENLAPGAKRLLAYLQSSPRPHPLSVLTRTLGPWIPNAVRALAHANLIEERASDQREPPASRTAQVARLRVAPEALGTAAETLARAPKQASLLKRMAADPGAAYLASTLRSEFGAAALSGLVDKGLVKIVDEIHLRHAAVERDGGPPLLH